MERVHNLLDDLGKLGQNILIVSHACVGRIINAKRGNIDSFTFYDLDP